MTGVEELDEVLRVLGVDFDLDVRGVRTLNAEQILTLLRACREATARRDVSRLPESIRELLPSELSAAQIEAAARRGEVPCFTQGDPKGEGPGRLAHLEAPSRLRVAVARRYHPVQKEPQPRSERSGPRITTGGCGHVPRPGICGACSEP